MKKLALIPIIALILSACTQNHGYIGHIFGSWYLYEMTEDGKPVNISIYGDTFWSFQSDLFAIIETTDYLNSSSHYGTWKESESELILNFNHSFGDYEPGTGNYGPPDWIGLPGTDNIVLTYLINKSDKLAFRYNADDGTVYEYFLQKTY